MNETDRPLQDAQYDDDEFRMMLLGFVCFCGANSNSEHRRFNDDKIVVTVAGPQDCAPLRCLAYGYCQAHSTPVHVQMSDTMRVRIMKRAGWMQPEHHPRTVDLRERGDESGG